MSRTASRSPLLVFVAFALMLTSLASPAFCDNHSGTIGTETWALAGSPHYIGADVTVSNACTLTIEAGCEVLFGGNYQILIYGCLIADGSPGGHITFTGDATPGTWKHIYFYTVEPGCLLDFCDIRYGGSAWGNIYAQSCGSNVTISNCTIEQSGGAGIYLYASAAPSISNCLIQDNAGSGIFCHSTSADPQISDCTIQNNGGYAIRTFADNVKDITGTMTIAGNTNNAVWVGGDDVTNGIWLNHAVPYVIGGDIEVSNGDTLTISPGCEARFDGNYQVLMYGCLIADGTPEAHIAFTSNLSPQAPGDWKYLYFYTVEPGCLLDYCDISYGGSAWGNVYAQSCGSNVTISHCTIEQSGGAGIYLYVNAAPSISDCTIQANTGAGIHCFSTSSDPLIAECAIQNNGGYAIRTFADNVKDITGTMTIAGNTNNAVWVGGDDVTNGIWLNHAVPYVIGGDIEVSNGDTLTISPGCEVRFDGNYQLVVYGTFVAAGTPGEHITFTSNLSPQAPGDWKFIYFYTVDPGCLLDYCDISYGGSAGGNIYAYLCGSNVAISNCTIEQSGGPGIYLYGTASPAISACTIQDNTGAGIYSHSSSATAQVNNCTIQGNQDGYAGSGSSSFVNSKLINNTRYGVSLSGNASPSFGSSLSEWNDIFGNGAYDFYNGTADVYAYYVYWGTEEPGIISSHIWDDFDNPALGVVYFSHWLSEDHASEYTLWAPVVSSITEAAGAVQLIWNAVPGAVSYRVNSSVKPWASYSVDNTGSFADTTWSAPLNGERRFYRVNAVAGSEVSAPSNIVGYEQYPTDTP